MQFVKDTVPWGSAIGCASCDGPARVVHRGVVQNRRDSLCHADGFYDLRITGELWKLLLDSLRLMTVDHPAGTEIFGRAICCAPVKLAVTRSKRRIRLHVQLTTTATIDRDSSIG